jgi:hypothetical protein
MENLGAKVPILRPRRSRPNGEVLYTAPVGPLRLALSSKESKIASRISHNDQLWKIGTIAPRHTSARFVERG